MSKSDDNNSCQSDTMSLEDKLLGFCHSDSLSEEGIHYFIELQKESTPDNYLHVSDYEFFHLACCNEKVTEGIIRCLLEYFPAAAAAADEDGCLPIHYACENKNVSLGIIRLLIDAAPDSVRRVDSYGNMPIHWLCSNKELGETTATQILKLLLEKYPESIQHVNNASLLPIHLAAIALKSPKFCRVLIEAYRGSERIADSIGRLPLHFACMHNTVETVEYLHNLYPDAIHNTMTSGLYPIHYAICALAIGGTNLNPGARVDIVKFLLSCDARVKFKSFGVSLCLSTMLALRSTNQT